MHTTKHYGFINVFQKLSLCCPFERKESKKSLIFISFFYPSENIRKGISRIKINTSGFECEAFYIMTFLHKMKQRTIIQSLMLSISFSLLL